MTTYNGSVTQSQPWSFTDQNSLISVNYTDSITFSVSGSNVEDLEFKYIYVTANWLSAHTPLSYNDFAANGAYFDLEGNGPPPTTIPQHTVATLSAANPPGSPPGFLDVNGQY